MLGFYILLELRKHTAIKDLNGRIVVIPKGTEGYTVDKLGDMYIVELVNKKNYWQITYIFYENEIERDSTSK